VIRETSKSPVGITGDVLNLLPSVWRMYPTDGSRRVARDRLPASNRAQLEFSNQRWEVQNFPQYELSPVDQRINESDGQVAFAVFLARHGQASRSVKLKETREVKSVSTTVKTLYPMN
jgi:hypothetical protein